VIWDEKRIVAINTVRYKYLIQKSFRVLPSLIQNLKNYITKGFWRGPHLFRNHYISEFNGELYTQNYFKKFASPDVLPNYNSCTDLKELLKMSTRKVNPYLVRSNSFSCGKEFPWVNSRSYNESAFKEANKKKRDEVTKDLFSENNPDFIIEDTVKNLDNYVNDHIMKGNGVLSKDISRANLADLTKDQICDIIMILYPDTESIVKIFTEEQPKFYIDSDDEYEAFEKIDQQVIKDEIKKSTTSNKLLNAISDSSSERNKDEIDEIDWGNDFLQEDIVYEHIKNNIENSVDYVPWRSETEELYFNPCNPNAPSYEKDLKEKVHEYLNVYNSNSVNGLSYKNRFDIKANIAHKLKGEEGDIDEGLIGEGLGVDIESKKGELTDYFDPQKTWFSLQDVMELTLLHAQQLELMNEEYTKQVDELNKKLLEAEVLQANLKNTIEINDDDSVKKELLKKVTELQETVRKQAAELKMLQEENDYYRENERLETINKPLAKQHKEGNISNTVKKEKRKIPHRIRKYSFFNRLEAFNSEKVRHRDRLLQEQVEKYLKDYEYRLSHENHLDKPNPEYEEMLNEWRKSGQKLKAEFMPIKPGLQRPKYYKELKKHGIESPWGGKFHITQDRKRDELSMNILNLFEIARKMKLQDKFSMNN